MTYKKDRTSSPSAPYATPPSSTTYQAKVGYVCRPSFDTTRPRRCARPTAVSGKDKIKCLRGQHDNVPGSFQKGSSTNTTSRQCACDKQNLASSYYSSLASSASENQKNANVERKYSVVCNVDAPECKGHARKGSGVVTRNSSTER